jgi:hypothetical protein
LKRLESSITGGIEMTVPDVVIDFFRQMEQEPWLDGLPVHAFTVDSMGKNMLDYAITNGNA